MGISVVIATYNRASLLQRTLEQLGAQAFQPGDEVIVVDNASTDATPQVIALGAQRFSIPLRHLREPRPGKTPAMIAGITVARGEILALTDDDVFPDPEWIATIRRLFEDPSIDLVGGRVDPRWERAAPTWLQSDQHGYGPMAAPLALLHYGDAQPLGERTALGANMAIRTSVLQSLGGFARHLGRHRGTLLSGEDHDLCQRAVAAGFRCEYRPELRVEHWVPADRARLRYFLRWFFWSGVTDATLRSTDPGRHGQLEGTVRHYLVRHLLTAPVSALWSALRGRTAEAAARTMDAAFAVGYIAQRMGILRLLKVYSAGSRASSRGSASDLDPKDAPSEPYGVIG